MKKLVAKRMDVKPLKKEKGNPSWDAFCESGGVIGPVKLNERHIYMAIENAEEHWLQNYGPSVRPLVCDSNKYGRFEEIEPIELVDDLCRWWSTMQKGRTFDDGYCLYTPSSEYEWSLVIAAREFEVTDAFDMYVNTDCYSDSKVRGQS